MTESVASLINVGVGFTVGNYLFQALTKKKWNTAFERSYFQGMALLAIYVVELAVKFAS